MGEISQLLLYLSKESPISFLLDVTLNPIKYSPTVLIHFAYPLPLITHKNRWELQTSVYLLEEKKPPTKEPPKGKNPSTKKEPTQTEERANLERPDKEIKETEPLNPTECLPQKVALQRQLARQSLRSCRNKQKDSPKMGR